jgi:hypothetical protein
MMPVPKEGQQQEDSIVEYSVAGFSRPPVRVIISGEFLDRHNTTGKHTQQPGFLVIGDEVDYTIGPYKIEVRFWDKAAEYREREYDLYMAERGEKFKAEQYEERHTDFERWKEERQQKK